MKLLKMNTAVSAMSAGGIRLWVRATGRRVRKQSAPWLECPMGPPGRIGAEFYAYLAERDCLQIKPSPDAGLLPSFDALKGADFDSCAVHPAIRDFYEHTACYRLEAWSEAGMVSRLFLWLLTRFVSRSMDQLNFPVSSLELAGGMTSEVLPLVENATGSRVFTGWLRRLAVTERVIYIGLYSIERPPNSPNPCVKVSFPLPYGSSTVFLRPEAQPDGSFKLISSGARFGDPGFYRMVETDATTWKVRYLRTLRELFHVYVDQEGILRTEHSVRFAGIQVLRLHYKMERRNQSVIPSKGETPPFAVCLENGAMDRATAQEEREVS
jgi:hypothetical protein